MSGDMAAAQIDSVVADKEDSIHEEIEELIACETAHPVSTKLLVSNGYPSSKRHTAGEWFASRPWGQMVFKCLDRVLWCCERTTLWQNPSEDNLAPMDRPVNVVVAYPLAAFLWVIQHLMFVGGERTSADEMISWVQTRRRRLRAVRFQGIRNMRNNNKLSCPESSLFAQVLWFLGLLPAEAVVAEHVDMKRDSEDHEDVVPAELGDSEQKKKRRFSAVSDTSDDGAAALLDDEYNSESDSDYLPDLDHSHSSESDLDLSTEDQLVEEEESGTEVEEEPESGTEVEEEPESGTEKKEEPESGTEKEEEPESGTEKEEEPESGTEKEEEPESGTEKEEEPESGTEKEEEPESGTEKEEEPESTTEKEEKPELVTKGDTLSAKKA